MSNDNTGFGQYEIQEQIGVGGMATVYRAYQPKLDRSVAIKVMHKMFLEDAGFTARFEREARIVARLDHPNIVPIYDYDHYEDQPYLVMKYLQGQTLKDLMRQRALSLDEIVVLMKAIASALSYAHQQGVLHRDMKPSNVIIDQDGTPYLTDFGLARIAKQGESTLSVDTMLGTPHYISPEQAQGGADLDARTDVYAMGIMLFEMTTGRLPFTGDNAYAVIHKQINAAPPQPSQLNPEIPPAVERVLLKALEKEPAKRYNTPDALLDAFEQAINADGLTELDASRVDRATNLGDLISHHTPGGGHYSTVSRASQVTLSARGKKSVIIPTTPPPDFAFPQTIGAWLELFIARLRDMIDDLRIQLGDRSIQDRVRDAAGELQSDVNKTRSRLGSSASRRPATNSSPSQVSASVAASAAPVVAVPAAPQAPSPETAQSQPSRVIHAVNHQMNPETQRAIIKDWGADNTSIRRRAAKRAGQRRGFMIHLFVYLVIVSLLIAVQGDISASIESAFTSAEFLDDPGQAVSDALVPLASIPIGLVTALMWGGGLASHALQTYSSTGMPLIARRREIDRRMTRFYGDSWRETAIDAQYKPVKREIEGRDNTRQGLMTHVLNTVLFSTAAFLVLPVGEQALADYLVTQGETLPVTDWTLIALAILWIPVALHAFFLMVRSMAGMDDRESAIQREIARESAFISSAGPRVTTGQPADPTDKTKREQPTYTPSLDSLIDRETADPPQVRLNSEGEFTESFVDEINPQSGQKES